MTLRPARMDDWARLWVWRNDPETRAQFWFTEPVNLESHLSWLRNALGDPKVSLFIAEHDGVPVGTVRLNHESDDRASVSITLEPQQRNHRLASPVIEELVGEARVRGVRVLRADIKPTNAASLRAFASAGFGFSEWITQGDELIRLECAVGA